MAGTRIEDVMVAIKGRIGARALVPGAKLASVRAAARSHKVSVSTVVEAYGRLVAEGVIVSRPGAGYFVAHQAAPMDLAAIGPRVDRAIDPFWVSRQSLETGPEVAKPGCGWLPPDWLPTETIRKSLRALSREETAVLAEYTDPLGLAGLRQMIARRQGEKGITVSPDQIVLTESGTQAIDLVCRLVLEAGDTVLVDDPCYFNFQALLRAHRAQIVSVPFTPEGPDVAAFEAMLKAHRPSLYITNCGIHNPTGAIVSPVVAHKVLTLAEAYRLTIVEDDIFADFEHTPAPRLASFDGFERVIAIGSFSKTLSAAARCGFIAAKPDWIERLVDLKIATAFGGGRISEHLVLAVLGDAGYRKHVGGLRARLERARDTVGVQLEAMGIVPWTVPRAGMFLWAHLPKGCDGAHLARVALEDELVLAPGNVFSPSQSAGAMMRFNVSQMEGKVIARLERALARVGR